MTCGVAVTTYQVQASPSLLEISPDPEKARIASAVQARQRVTRPPATAHGAITGRAALSSPALQ